MERMVRKVVQNGAVFIDVGLCFGFGFLSWVVGF